MILKGILGFFAILVVGLAILGYTPLPEGMGDRYKVHVIQGTFKVFNQLTSAAKLFGYQGSSLLLMKDQFTYNPDKAPATANHGDIQVSRDKIAGIPVIIYRPKNIPKSSPAVIFFHGGGWTVGSPDLYDRTVYYYVQKTNVIAISVDYRLAPEHVFPAAAEDCLTVTRYILSHGGQYGIDVKKVGISGDSAGGNLVAVVALRLSQEKSNLPPLKFQIMHYPSLQAIDLKLPAFIDGELPMLRRSSIGPFLACYFGLDTNKLDYYAEVFANNRHVSPEFIKEYAKYIHVDNLPKEFQTPNNTFPEVKAPYDAEVFNKIKDILTNPLFSPLVAPKLSGPPAFIQACEFDILRDDAFLYAKRLREAGIEVDFHFGKGGWHGDIIKLFPDFLYPSSGEAALSAAADFAKRMFKQ